MKVKVIATVGQNGSGKDEVLKYIHAKYGLPFLATGDIVREIAGQEEVEPTRDNLRDISERYFNEFGKGCFVKRAADQICQRGWKIACISGIRSLDDVMVLRNRFGKGLILIRVYISDPRERYERLHKRGEERDPHDFDEFLRQDRAEEELFRIKAAERCADYALSNDGTLEELHQAIDHLISERKLPVT